MTDQPPSENENEHEPDGVQQPGPDEPTAEHEVGAEQPRPEAPTAPPAPGPGPRRLYRSRSDRVLAGVCGGIARYFNIDPVLVRVGAVALVFLGGTGLILYLGLALLVPNEGEGGAPPEGPRRSVAIAGVILLIIAVCVALPFRGGWWGGWSIVPLGLLALAGLFVWRLATGERPQGNPRSVLRAIGLGIALIAVCCALAFGAAWATAAGGSGVVAGVVIAAGVALIASAFAGDRARWLIVPALAIALPAGAVAATGVDVKGGYGERTYRPASPETVRDSYRLGAGHLVVDLRRAQLAPGDHRINLHVGVGEADLIVPRNVCVSTDSHVGVGGIEVFSHTGGGVDYDWQDEREPRDGAPRVILDGDIGIGALTVHHDDIERWDDGHQPGNAACA